MQTEDVSGIVNPADEEEIVCQWTKKHQWKLKQPKK